jgi:hypothetical protein
MWSRRRRESTEGHAPTVLASGQAETDPPLEELLAEIERLDRHRGGEADRDHERRLLRLRHLAGIKLIDGAPGDPRFCAPAEEAVPEAGIVPEVPAGELRAGLLRAAILRHGCLLVRGLVAREPAGTFAAEIDRAYEQRTRRKAGRRPTPGYYEEFEPAERFGPVQGRGWIEAGGGLLAADSPRLALAMRRILSAAGLPSLVSEYLGEPALISVHKTTLRKAEPSVPGAWHQDGKFMGPVRSLNLWLSLSRCGDLAPGLDIVPRRLEHHVSAGTEEAALYYTISEQNVAAAAGELPIVRPIFEPGDALLFDELFLHKTGSDPGMPNPRYAIENWFFGGSAFPGEYAPLAV